MTETLDTAAPATPRQAPQIHGSVKPGFEPVREAFATLWTTEKEVGASVAVQLDGDLVVDLWAGDKDSAGSPWTQDTLMPVFSTTKGLTATCAHLLASRAELDYDKPVAHYWPEFAQNSKHDVTVRHILTHAGGLPAFEPLMTVAQCHDFDFAASTLAAQEPRWKPGTTHGYHAITYGWLVGNLIKRITGSSLGQFFASEVASALGLDTYIGLPGSEEQRVGRLLPITMEMILEMASGLESSQHSIELDDVAGSHDTPLDDNFISSITNPDSLLAKVFMNPPLILEIEVFNSPEMHAAEWPAANGITDARSLAKLYGALSTGWGLTPAIFAEATTEQRRGKDEVLAVESAFGLGYLKASELCSLDPHGGGFGHGGAGGSLGFGDPARGLGFGYVMNQMYASVGPDPRPGKLVEALYGCL